MARDAEALELAMITARIEAWPQDSQQRMVQYLVTRFGLPAVTETQDVSGRALYMREWRRSQRESRVTSQREITREVSPHTPVVQLLESSNGSKRPRPHKQEAIEVLGFLNEKAGRTYRPVDTNLKLIEARIASGATPQNCKGVVARKVREWKNDPKMNKFLRPSTLFSQEKFEQYLGEREPEGVGDGD